MTELNYTVDYGYDRNEVDEIDEVECCDELESGIMDAIDSLRANGYAVIVINPRDIQALPGNPDPRLLESSAKTGIALTFGKPFIY